VTFFASAVGVSVALTTLCCSGPNKNAVDAQAEVPAMPRTDIEGLERLINLPCRPIDVKWATSTRAGSDNWSLRVVLHFAVDDLQSILRGAADPGGKKGYMSPEQLAWMPESVRASAVPSRSEELLVVDAIPIGIEQFAAPKKSPLIQGTALVFLKQNLVYLGLYTM
jgi:hypothetical protein